MAFRNEETERPAEWLRRLQECSGAYQALVQQSGGLAQAAYRLARARCLVQDISTRIPTLREVHAAARVIAGQLGLADHKTHLTALAEECEYSGLPVLGPLQRLRRAG